MVIFPSAQWQPMEYAYDGTFEGFLSCVFESYQKKELPTAFYSDEDALTLFAVRYIETDPVRTQRVLRHLVKLSPPAAQLVRRVFFTCLPQREGKLYSFLTGLYQQGPALMDRPLDPLCYPLHQANRHLMGELERFRGFVRFSDYGGMLGAEIEPKNRVLFFLRHHFCGRYRNESFFLYDRTHKEVLFSTGGRGSIVPLAHFTPAPPVETEWQYRRLWKTFYDHIAIESRISERRRQTHLPNRYRSTMTEFHELPSPSAPPQNSSAASAGRGAPDGRPAPEKPAIPGQSAPA